MGRLNIQITWRRLSGRPPWPGHVRAMASRRECATRGTHPAREEARVWGRAGGARGRKLSESARQGGVCGQHLQAPGLLLTSPRWGQHCPHEQPWGHSDSSSETPGPPRQRGQKSVGSHEAQPSLAVLTGGVTVMSTLRASVSGGNVFHNSFHIELKGFIIKRATGGCLDPTEP